MNFSDLCIVLVTSYPITRHFPNAGLMLDQLRRRWPSIKPTLSGRLILAEVPLTGWATHRTCSSMSQWGWRGGGGEAGAGIHVGCSSKDVANPANARHGVNVGLMLDHRLRHWPIIIRHWLNARSCLLGLQLTLKIC